VSSSRAGNAREQAGLSKRRRTVGNTAVGKDGLPVEEKADGSFFITDSSKLNKEFEEIIDANSAKPETD